MEKLRLKTGAFYFKFLKKLLAAIQLN